VKTVSCESCSQREGGALCSVPPEAWVDWQSFGVTSIYKPRQVVFSEGNPSRGLYLVCRGSVKLYHSDRSGRDHALEIVGPAAVLGELGVHGDRPLSISAQTLTAAQISFLPRAELLSFLRHYPETALAIIDALSRELSKARRGVRDLALRGAESRLAALLVRLAGGDPTSAGIEIPYRRREIAEMIGVSTETAIRLLGKLREKGIIGIHRREITFLDFARLARIGELDGDQSEDG